MTVEGDATAHLVASLAQKRGVGSANYALALKETYYELQGGGSEVSCLYLLARHFEYKNELQNAYSLYKDIITKYPRSPEALLAQNKIDLDSAYTHIDENGASHVYVHSNDDSQTAFVGDLSLSLIYECSCNLTCEVGYRALWVTGLALAAENLQTNPEILRLGPPQIDDEGEIVYHGPHVGVTVRW